MERTEKRSRVKNLLNKIQETNTEENKEINERENLKNIWGWENAVQVANEVWRDGNYKLLEGRLIFAFRNTDGSKPGLYQLIVVQNPMVDINGVVGPGNTFGISMVTTSYSALIPIVTIEYLESEVLLDFEKYKVNPRIVETYKQIIEDIKEELKLL